MSDRNIAIQVRGLGKKYRIGGPQEKYYTFRDAITSTIRAPFRHLSGPSPDEEFWALKDVSFDIGAGEVVGIIGRNGAGKSTLLKILSRITSPTEGTVDLYGRVGSLLEVGTGFHPELTGRENIFLSGSILGMKKREIEDKLDDIVKFSEIEKFLDTPAKRYSSGMYVRLAFAVAAHLEPEILLVDEVLAVGDAAFQKKCLGKMDKIAKEGRTVLFVSHQMNTIRKLCPRTILIENGRIDLDSCTNDVINRYESESKKEVPNILDLTNNHKIAQFHSWEVVRPSAGTKHSVETTEEIEFKISLYIKKQIRHVHHGIDIWDKDNHLIWGWCTDIPVLEAGHIEFHYVLPTFPLKSGNYYLHTSLYSEQKLLDEWNGLPALTINTIPLSHPRDEFSGILNVPCRFRSELLV